MALMQAIIGASLLVCLSVGQYITGKAGVIATFTGTVNGGKPCYFPFKYKGKMYSYCTLADHIRPWCATTSNYDTDKQWGNCVNVFQSQIVASKRNGGSENCVFPFIYKGVNYTDCITQKNNRPWCSTTDNYDRDRMYGECQVYKVQDIQTYGGTGGNQACAFPFIYNNIYRFDCIIDNFNTPWCGCTENYGADKKWGICVPSNVKVKTYKGTGGGADCVFPFVYEGVERVGCINDDNRKLWCATTNNYDTDKKWGRCVLYPKEVTTREGNSFGRPCNFPFRFEGKDYWGCITSTGRGRPWCGTLRNYDTSLAWGVCNIPSTTATIYTVKGNAGGAKCRLPFIFQGRTYYNCITQDEPDAWCATTANYDTDRKWGYCYKYSV